MKYDVRLKFTTDNSVMWVGVVETRTKKDLGTHCLTCDELAEWLLEREKQAVPDSLPKGVLCLMKIFGRCDRDGCEHGEFHEPVETSGFTCTVDDGVCSDTDFRTHCISVTDRRKKQLLSLGGI